MNPMGLNYDKVVQEILAAWARASGVIITGRENRNDPLFQWLREAGCEVWAYLNWTLCPDRPAGDLDREFYLFKDGTPNAPLWIPARVGYIHPATGVYHRVADVTADGLWARRTVNYIEEKLFPHFDGVLLDDGGPRMWTKTEGTKPGADWETWPIEERRRFTEGKIDLLVQLDARRNQHPTRRGFKIVPNGMWEWDKTIMVADLSPARVAIDGLMIEHHPSTRLSAITAAGRDYGTLGQRRFVWITNNDEANAVELVKKIPGVTHIASQASYAAPGVPPVQFEDLRGDEYGLEIDRLHEDLAARQRIIDVQALRLQKAGELAAPLNEVLNPLL